MKMYRVVYSDPEMTKNDDVFESEPYVRPEAEILAVYLSKLGVQVKGLELAK